MKTEPEVYSIDDLKRDKEEPWEGIRNYQARNFMRDDMKLGDGVLIYHSNSKPSGIAGTATICKEAHPDTFALDPKSKYFFPKATPEKNPWVMVKVKYKGTFKNIISLEDIRATKGLEEMLVIRKGSRLSIQPVTKKEYELILKKFS